MSVHLRNFKTNINNEDTLELGILKNGLKTTQAHVHKPMYTHTHTYLVPSYQSPQKVFEFLYQKTETTDIMLINNNILITYLEVNYNILCKAQYLLNNNERASESIRSTCKSLSCYFQALRTFNWQQTDAAKRLHKMGLEAVIEFGSWKVNVDPAPELRAVLWAGMGQQQLGRRERGSC